MELGGVGIRPKASREGKVCRDPGERVGRKIGGWFCCSIPAVGRKGK